MSGENGRREALRRWPATDGVDETSEHATSQPPRESYPGSGGAAELFRRFGIVTRKPERWSSQEADDQ